MEALFMYTCVVVGAWYGGEGQVALPLWLVYDISIPNGDLDPWPAHFYQFTEESSNYLFLSLTHAFLNNSFGQNLRLVMFVLEGC